MSRRHAYSERGFVLVIVLWVLAILTVVVLSFGRRAMLERQSAWYALDRQQAQQMARGAAEYAILQLQNKSVVDEMLSVEGYTSLNQAWAQKVNLLEIDGFYFAGDDADFSEDVCEYRIRDCDSRLSLNYGDAELFEGVELLERGTREAILARRDAPTLGAPPNFFLAVDELRNHAEFSDELWYGEQPGDGLRDLFTVWGETPTAKINMNTASEAVLNTLPDVDPVVVRDLMVYRKGDDGLLGTRDDRAFTLVSELGPALGVSRQKVQPFRNHCKTHSSFFTIEAHASRRRGAINAYCTVTVEVRGARLRIHEWREGT